jgi:hypothetical protein
MDKQEEMSNSKIQISNKSKIPISKFQTLYLWDICILNIGAYLGFGVWDLEFLG